jgi:hypothetical protein
MDYNLTQDEADLLQHIARHPFHDRKKGVALIGSYVPSLCLFEPDYDSPDAETYINADIATKGARKICDGLVMKSLVTISNDHGDWTVALTESGYDTVMIMLR